LCLHAGINIQGGSRCDGRLRHKETRGWMIGSVWFSRRVDTLSRVSTYDVEMITKSRSATRPENVGGSQRRRPPTSPSR
jgi:hypothetical protein